MISFGEPSSHENAASALRQLGFSSCMRRTSEFFSGINSGNDDSHVFGRDVSRVGREGNRAIGRTGNETDSIPKVAIEAELSGIARCLATDSPNDTKRDDWDVSPVNFAYAKPKDTYKLETCPP